VLARKPTQIFFAVIKALFIRELWMRISVSKSGLFWTFFEPFMQVFVFTLIHAAVFSHRSGGFDYTTFIAINFVAYNLFKNIIKKSVGSFVANKGLFIYKQVKPIDTIISRALVELYITGVVSVIFILLGYYLGFDLQIKNFPMVAFALIWLMIFSIGLGVLLAVGNSFFPSVGKTVNVVMIFLLFGSAVFYSLETIPATVRELLLFNPLVHFMEMIHGWWMYDLDDRYVSYSYLSLWTLGVLFISLLLYRHYEERIISS